MMQVSGGYHHSEEPLSILFLGICYFAFTAPSAQGNVLLSGGREKVPVAEKADGLFGKSGLHPGDQRFTRACDDGVDVNVRRAKYPHARLRHFLQGTIQQLLAQDSNFRLG